MWKQVKIDGFIYLARFEIASFEPYLNFKHIFLVFYNLRVEKFKFVAS